VTGASGFVGGHLVKHLLEQGHEVKGTSRKMDPLFPKEDQYEHVTLDDPFSIKTWRPITSGVDAVVHLIAKTHSPDTGKLSELEEYRHINVDITKAVLKASLEAGVRRFIYMSSIKAVGEETAPGEAFTEDSPCEPADSYGISKREAEELILNYSEKIGTVILRPPLIYGPGVKGNFLRLLKLVDKGYPLPLAGLKNARSLLYVGNLTSAISKCVVNFPIGGKIYHISDGEAPSTPELLSQIASAIGTSFRVFPFPPTFLETSAGIIGKREMFKKLTRSLVLSAHCVEKEIGFVPEVSFNEGIAITVEWFLKNLNKRP